MPAAPPWIDHASPGATVYPPGNESAEPASDTNPSAALDELYAEVNTLRRRRKAPKKANPTARLLLLLLFVLVPVGGAVLYQRYVKDLFTARVEQPKPSSELSQRTGPRRKEPAAEPPPQKHRTASLQEMLADLVAALAKRDVPRAQDIVAEARANAQSPDDQKTLDKYEKLSEYVGGFWRIIGDRVKKFKPSEEVTLGKTRIIVVEAQDGRFSIKYGSRIQNYTVETMPLWLVIALVDSNLASDGPSKELYGAVLAVEPEGDRSRARSLWSEAASKGIKIDQSLPSLDSPPFTQKQ